MMQPAVPDAMGGQNTQSKALPVEHQDIRHFVARRLPDWLASAR
jgi:hypothetical protein